VWFNSKTCAYCHCVFSEDTLAAQFWSPRLIYLHYNKLYSNVEKVPELFNDKLISVITCSTFNKISTIPVVYSDSQELTGELHHSGDQPLTLFNWLHANWHFFLSPSKNCTSKEEDQDAEDIKRNVTTNLYAVPLDTFHNCFVQFIQRCKKCVTVKEDDFERKGK